MTISGFRREGEPNPGPARPCFQKPGFEVDEFPLRFEKSCFMNICKYR